MLLRYVIYFSNMHVCFISWLTMCIITYGFYLQHGMIQRWSLGYKMAPKLPWWEVGTGSEQRVRSVGLECWNKTGYVQTDAVQTLVV